MLAVDVKFEQKMQQWLKLVKRSCKKNLRQQLREAVMICLSEYEVIWKYWRGDREKLRYNK